MNRQHTIGPDTVVARNDEPIAVEVDQTVVMMSLAQGMYFGLEGAGPRIWSLLERPHSAAELAAELVADFEVDEATCLRDVCDFLDALKDAQLIRIQDEAAPQVPPPAAS